MKKGEQILFNESQAAECLSLSTRTLRKARSAGQLRCILIGRAVRYTMEDLEAFVDSLREGKPPCQPETKPAKAARRNRQSGEVIPFHQRPRSRARDGL